MNHRYGEMHLSFLHFFLVVLAKKPHFVRPVRFLGFMPVRWLKPDSASNESPVSFMAGHVVPRVP